MKKDEQTFNICPEAGQDVLQAYRYYKNIDEKLADHFYQKFRKEINLIRSFPKSSAIVYKNFRRSLLSTFPYAIEETHIRVFAVIHQRRYFEKLLSDRNLDLEKE